MSGKGGRFFAGFFAVLFLITSSAFAIIVILTSITQNKSNDSSAKNTQNQQQTPPKDKLAGTKLSGFTPVAKVAKLQEVDLKDGTGATVKPGDVITADYTGAVASTGVIFQSSKDTGQPATFSQPGHCRLVSGRPRHESRWHQAFSYPRRLSLWR